MITEGMTIEELVERYPATIKPFSELGVKCIVCGEPVWETIEQNVMKKGLNNLEEIIQVLRNVVVEN